MVEILTGITQGNADAGIFTSPTTLKAQHTGLKELVNVTEQNIPMIHAALASTKDYIKTRPDNVRRFLQAYLEGIKIASTEPEFAKQVIGKYTKTTDAADLENSYQTFLPAWVDCPSCRRRPCRPCSTSQPIPSQDREAQTLIDNSILIEIGKSGFVDRLYK